MPGDGGGSGRSRRRRPLHAEEKALWEHVVRSIQPMRPLPRVAPPKADTPAAATPETDMTVTTGKPRPPRPTPLPAPAAPKRPPGPPPLAPLEPKLRRRLSRGAEVDARLDLHGLTQAAAHGRLIAFLRGAQGSGHALVLVITGKGDGTGFAGEGGRGVLRRLVPQWLGAPEMRSIVVGFETAGRGHGGEGALYVRVRRAREGWR